MKLRHLGWNDRFESLFASIGSKDLVPGRVTRVDRGAVTVQMTDGSVAATLAGRLEPDGEVGPAAGGDWVGLEVENAIVRVILPRTGALARRRPGGADHEQVAAANVDLVLIVESVERGPNPRRIERAVALAWDGGATPVVVLTKMDLCEDRQSAIERAKEGAPFAEVLTVSAKTGEGTETISGLLSEGTTAVLLGPSGVGKSTLINRLLGEERLAVGEVRSGDRKGRHTTTHRELVVLPSGGCVIDTPGIRELGLWLDAEHRHPSLLVGLRHRAVLTPCGLWVGSLQHLGGVRIGHARKLGPGLVKQNRAQPPPLVGQAAPCPDLSDLVAQGLCPRRPALPPVRSRPVSHPDPE